MEPLAAVSVSVQSPTGPAFKLTVIPGIDSEVSLRQALAQIPELLHYTSYHLELVRGADSQVIDASMDLRSSSLKDGEVLKMVLDDYTVLNVRGHVENLLAHLRLQRGSGPSLDGDARRAVAKRNAALLSLSYESLRRQVPDLSKNPSTPANPTEVALTPELEVSVVSPQDPLLPPIGMAAGRKSAVHSVLAQLETGESVRADGEISESLASSSVAVPSASSAPSLSSLYAKKSTDSEFHVPKVPVCLKSMRFSGWNPVPAFRKVLGDLSYLEVETLEGELYFITATPVGFYVNKSRKDFFDPTPSPRPCHSLDLVSLIKQISSQFRKQYALLLQQRKQHADLGEWENYLRFPMPSVSQHPSWLAAPVTDDDVIMGQYHTYETFEEKASHKSVDCVESYQSLLDKLIEDPDVESKKSDLHQLLLHFVDVCKTGVSGVLEGAIPPYVAPVPGENPIFLHENVFFCSCDSASYYSYDLQNEDCTRVGMNQNVIGIRCVNGARPKGIKTDLLTVVDYLGERFFAEGMIPGIMQSSDSLVFGSLNDKGGYIAFDESINQKLKPIFESMGSGLSAIHPTPLKDGEEPDESGFKSPSVVYSKPDDVIALYGSAYTKVVKGSDGRLYLLENIPLFPRDLAYMEKRKSRGQEPEMAILRPEAVNSYYLQMSASEKPLRLNLNIGGSNSLADSSEKIAKDTAAIHAVCAFVQGKLIPSAVESLLEGKAHVDAPEQLSVFLHSCGVNLRYLSEVHRACGASSGRRAQFMQELVEIEAVARACKYASRRFYRLPGAKKVASVVAAAILNAVFAAPGSNVVADLSVEGVQRRNAPKRQINLGLVSAAQAEGMKKLYQSLQPSDIWKDVAARLESHFDLKLTHLPCPLKKSVPDHLRLPLLRRVCAKCGIQLVAQDYNFSSVPFSPENISSLSMEVKSIVPDPIPNRHDVIETVESYLASGNFSAAFEMCELMIQDIYAICGYPHESLLYFLHTKGKILREFKRYDGAISHEKVAIRLATQFYGDCDPSLCPLLQTLALYLSENGSPNRAIEAICQSIQIRLLTSGSSHPELAAGYLLLADILLHHQRYSQASEEYSKVLGMEAKISPKSVSYLKALKGLTKSEFLRGNVESALAHAKELKAECDQNLPAEDPLRASAARLLENVEKA